ncbi:MAG: hypothetical protein M3521_12880 [Acidobacteriota bacterium]|jgi:hypothetical protein|nr:hypothetical protein [Acidobacteriota bacterium]MDQ3374766.1 hypothetical protein [Acidobacteriota bacterium]
MSLMICPECAHEVSSAATACPNCAHPFVTPVVTPVIQRKVIVEEVMPEREGFPKWAFIPLGLLGLVLLFVLFAFMRNNDDEAQKNVNVKIGTTQTASNTRETTLRADSAPNEIVVPPSSQPGQVYVPQSSTSAPSSQSTTIQSVPPETIVSDKGTVKIEAKVAGTTGGARPVGKENFYLLDKDLQSILSEADIDDEEGQGLTNAFGLSVVYPSKYGETNKKAMNAINKHIVYKTITDGSGKAQIKDVKPDSYYLFGITKSSNGFAIWSSPVTIQAGDNSLVLPPARLTEIIE